MGIEKIVPLSRLRASNNQLLNSRVFQTTDIYRADHVSTLLVYTFFNTWLTPEKRSYFGANLSTSEWKKKWLIHNTQILLKTAKSVTYIDRYVPERKKLNFLISNISSAKAPTEIDIGRASFGKTVGNRVLEVSNWNAPLDNSHKVL